MFIRISFDSISRSIPKTLKDFYYNIESFFYQRF